LRDIGTEQAVFVSTVIPTIGRPTLSRAVESVLAQVLDGDEFEVIVVNDSGRELPDADWQHLDQVHVISTNRRERSVARNAGAAVAKGRYLHFLDDDDWILPRAFLHFQSLAACTASAWLYGGSQLVDRMGTRLIQLHHQLSGNCFTQVMAGEWIPLQASLVASDAFFRVGGFNPGLSGPEDVDLCRRVALQYDLAFTRAVVACVGMGAENSTTDQAGSVKGRRRARERILSAPGAFSRMRGSATSSYWHGRILRAYLTSAAWNVNDGRGFAALSRAGSGLAALALSGHHVFSRSYWQAVARRYESETFTKASRRESGSSLRRELPGAGTSK
jgi:glycosyltransferase involved in cell wall biosynthesis